MTDKITKTTQEWQSQLTEEQYSVCRLSKTEPPFANKYWDCHDDGIYQCACCGQALFSSTAKFDSRTGWPSFFQTMSPSAIHEKTDLSHGVKRTEVVCSYCDAHLGHVFDDGPQPTGLRYCINSAALNLIK